MKLAVLQVELYKSFTTLSMSKTPEADKPQGATTLEERISAVEETPEAPKEEPQAPAATPTAQADEESSEDVQSLTTEEQESDLSDEEEREALANAKNPERTRAYIERLKAERDAARTPTRSQPQSVFDEFRIPSADQYAGLNQHEVDSLTHQIVEDDGTVDVARLNAALAEANQKALFAQQQAQQTAERVQRYGEGRQLKEAYEIFPQLDPKHKKFDPNFYEMVSQKIMVENYAKGGAMTVKQAAEHINQFYRRPETNLEKVKDEAVQEYKENQAKRQQGPVEKGKGEPRVALEDHEDLRARTRRGDAGAVAERLKALDI